MGEPNLFSNICKQLELQLPVTSQEIFGEFNLLSGHPWEETASSEISTYYPCLYGIVQNEYPRRILEIGTAFGLSAATLLKACTAIELFISIDLGVYGDQMGFPSNNIDFARYRIHGWCCQKRIPLERVRFYRANTQPVGKGDNEDMGADIPRWHQIPELVRLLESYEFDVIFIDGKHTEDGLLNDLDTFWPFLKPGGLIICDDLHDEATYKSIFPWAGDTVRSFESFLKKQAPSMNDSFIWNFPRVPPEGYTGLRPFGLIRKRPIHHLVFTNFKQFKGEIDPAFQVNFLGVVTRNSFIAGLVASLGQELPTFDPAIPVSYPVFDEEYFEWIDLLEAVLGADKKFTMIELGAGYGRWLVNAAFAVKHYHGELPIKLIGLEAEPTHFRWMRQHFLDNGIDPGQHELIHSAVDEREGTVYFHTGKPDEWYGQSIAQELDSLPESVIQVKATTLNEILRDVDSVDLVDLDVQGAELAVLRSAIEELNGKVRRIHIGTHGCNIEQGLRELFGKHEWFKVNDYPCNSLHITKWGKISFGDGVQTWLNPRLIQRKPPSQPLWGSPGFEMFDSAEAVEINRARLDHLASLGLDLANRSVLEVGAGVGWHTGFFEKLGCSVVSTDARMQNVQEHRRRYPHRKVEVADLAIPGSHDRFGEFDIVYCYGTLYHLSNPSLCLQELSKNCRGLFLLETCVSLEDHGTLNPVEEDSNNPNQSFEGLGCRPSRNWIMFELGKHYPYVYTTTYQPEHVEFPTTWPAALAHGIENVRAVFVASRHELHLSGLSPHLLNVQRRLRPVLSERAFSQDSSAVFDVKTRERVYMEREERFSCAGQECKSGGIDKNDRIGEFMGFPTNDRFWMDTVDFLIEKVGNHERLLAPGEFNAKFPRKIYPYSSTLTETSVFHWAVIHKGTMEEVDDRLLTRISKEFHPVFANEVFVVFSKRKDLKKVDEDSPHIVSFWEKMKIRRSSRRFLSGIIGGVFKKLKGLGPSVGEKVSRVEFSLLKTLKGGEMHRDMVYLGDNRALTRTMWGHKMFVDTRDISLAPHILLDGYWEMWITKFFMDTVKEGMTVVEVGSNIGYYTLIAASRIGPQGKVYAFEANPQVFEILFRNIEINGFLGWVTLVNKAAMDKSGSLKFHRSKHHHAGGSIVPFSDEFLTETREESETIEVEAVSLDEYFADQETKVDAMKIDAEGAEPFIFKGMRRLLSSNRDIKIIFEFTPTLYASQGLDPRAFLNDLMSQGFKVKHINPQSQLEEMSIERLLEIPLCEVFLER